MTKYRYNIQYLTQAGQSKAYVPIDILI